MGKIEKAVLQHLTEGRTPWCAKQLAFAVFGHGTPAEWDLYEDIIGPVTPAELASIKRALRRLSAKIEVIERRNPKAGEGIYIQGVAFGRVSTRSFWALATV